LTKRLHSVTSFKLNNDQPNFDLKRTQTAVAKDFKMKIYKTIFNNFDNNNKKQIGAVNSFKKSKTVMQVKD